MSKLHINDTDTNEVTKLGTIVVAECENCGYKHGCTQTKCMWCSWDERQELDLTLPEYAVFCLLRSSAHRLSSIDAYNAVTSTR